MTTRLTAKRSSLCGLLQRRSSVSLAQPAAALLTTVEAVGLIFAPPARRENAPPGSIRAACCGPAQSPFCLRLRDQIRLKVSPSSTRLA